MEGLAGARGNNYIDKPYFICIINCPVQVKHWMVRKRDCQSQRESERRRKGITNFRVLLLPVDGGPPATPFLALLCIQLPRSVSSIFTSWYPHPAFLHFACGRIKMNEGERAKIEGWEEIYKITLLNRDLLRSGFFAHFSASSSATSSVDGTYVGTPPPSNC